MKKYWQFLITFVLVVVLSVISNSWVNPQIDSPTGDKIDGFPVLLADETLFVIQTNVGSFSSEERAQTITNRLLKIANDTSLDLNLLRLEAQDETTNIVIGNKTLLTLTEADAKAAQIARTELANQYLAKIQNSLQTYRKERSAKHLIRSVIYTVIATVILLIIQVILSKIFPRLYRLLDSWRETRIPSIRIQNLELVRA